MYHFMGMVWNTKNNVDIVSIWFQNAYPLISTCRSSGCLNAFNNYTTMFTMNRQTPLYCAIHFNIDGSSNFTELVPMTDIGGMVSRTHSRYTRCYVTLCTCSLIKPVVMERMISLPAKIHTGMSLCKTYIDSTCWYILLPKFFSLFYFHLSNSF